MTTIDRTHTEARSFTLAVADFLETAATRIRTSYTWHKSYSRTHRELSALADYELHDLGISRWDIEQVSADAAQEAVNRAARA